MVVLYYVWSCSSAVQSQTHKFREITTLLLVTLPNSQRLISFSLTDTAIDVS